jgi:membrane-bound lytic murein transglycosylase F
MTPFPERLLHRRAAMRRAVVVLFILLASCGREAPPPRAAQPTALPDKPQPAESPAPTPNRIAPIARDLAQIADGGELAVLFTFNSTGYFMYRGETLGYEYELLEMFAKERHLHLKPVVVRDSRELYAMLDRGEGDVIAAQLVAGNDTSQIALTDSLYETAPMVVQRKGEALTAASPTVRKALQRQEQETPGGALEIRARIVTTPSELGGQQVHIARSSPYRPRLVELNEELTNDVVVVEVDESTDRLIQRLAEGDIGFTVAAENVASLRAGEYKNLIVRPALGPPEPVVWGIRTNAPELRAALNQWLAAKRKSGLLRVLYRKYFEDRNAFRRRAASRYLTAETGRLSPYDDLFREHARIPGWDWRLVASQAYQESRFNPKARSWAGAVGIMQIMPRTARELRVNPADPAQSIEGACRYLWKLDDQWQKLVRSERERVKFILAAYNVGAGHVQDAQRLAEKHGDDPAKWDDVAYWLVRKSQRAVYNDPVVKYGFARGTEPVTYVDVILDRWEHYKVFVPEEPAVIPPVEPPATSTSD